MKYGAVARAPFSRSCGDHSTLAATLMGMTPHALKTHWRRGGQGLHEPVVRSGGEGDLWDTNRSIDGRIAGQERAGGEGRCGVISAAPGPSVITFTIRLHENRILAPQQVTLLGVRTCCSDFNTNGASYQQFDVTTTPTILHT